MFARTTLRLDDGLVAHLVHGDIIGRLWSAALPVDDPRVSEAHALVSLRGGELWLLALRRPLSLDGRVVNEVRLEPGQRVGLAEGLGIDVLAVELPSEVLGIEAPGLPRVVLPSVAALRGRPRPRLQAGYHPDADAQIWTTGHGWRIARGAVVETLRPGRWEVEGATFTVVPMALRAGGALVTEVSGGVDPPLSLWLGWDTARLQRGGDPPVVLPGVSARILTELALTGPASWDAIAREVWRQDRHDEATLRKRWDVAVTRLRARLRDARVRPDLVHADGTGQFSLLLREGDRVETPA